LRTPLLLDLLSDSLYRGATQDEADSPQDDVEMADSSTGISFDKDDFSMIT